MKTSVLSAALVALLGGHAGLAAAQQGYGDVARVTSATPITQRVTEDRRECRVEQVSGYVERREAPAAPSGAGAVVGAIVGGLIGNQVEKDNANAPGDTVVERTPTAREVERCRWIPETRDRIVAYDVTYEYNGHTFRARRPYDPGQEMPVNVEVRPPAPPRTAYAPPPPPAYRY